MKNNISFIIPAYNCEKTIEEAIRSILDSNFVLGDEIVIVNDYSTDNTGKIINEYKDHKSIKIYTNPINLGGGSTRNIAVINSKNKYIFCLDSDNVLEKNSIKHLRNFIEAEKADIATFGEVKYFKKNLMNVTHSWIYKHNDWTLNKYFSDNNPGSSGNYLYSKDSWVRAGRYPESSGALDTWGFGFKQLVSGSKMVSLKGTYYYHRYGNESYWIKEVKDGDISLKALQIIIPYYHKIDPSDAERILSRNNINSWFENLQSKPVKFLDDNKYFHLSYRLKYHKILQAIKNKIKK